MSVSQNMLYSKTHEWVRVEGAGGGKIATMGLTAFALELLTDLVHVELPPPGRKVMAGQPLGEIESVKAVSDVYSPVDGEVAEVNSAIIGNLQHLPEDPYNTGWLVKIKVGNETGLAALLDEAAYKKQCAEEQH
jgi:glycine cleavage system H protein